MVQMILTDEQLKFLAETREPVEIIDRAGRILTRIKPAWTEAEVAEAVRKAKESGLGGSPREALEHLKLTYPTQVPTP